MAGGDYSEQSSVETAVLVVRAAWASEETSDAVRA
jgi:hypothetical protein